MAQQGAQASRYEREIHGTAERVAEPRISDAHANRQQRPGSGHDGGRGQHYTPVHAGGGVARAKRAARAFARATSSSDCVMGSSSWMSIASWSRRTLKPWVASTGRGVATPLLTSCTSSVV